MKHVNLDPRLEKKKEEIMQEFRRTNDDGPATVRVKPPTLASAAKPVAAKPVAAEPTTADASPPSGDVLKERVIDALKNIYDPEIPVNIYDLGLIYRVEITDGFAAIDMTLTAPGCPVAQTFPGMVEGAVKGVPGIADATVELVWEPPWTQALISEAARLELGLI